MWAKELSIWRTGEKRFVFKLPCLFSWMQFRPGIEQSQNNWMSVSLPNLQLEWQRRCLQALPSKRRRLRSGWRLHQNFELLLHILCRETTDETGCLLSMPSKYEALPKDQREIDNYWVRRRFLQKRRWRRSGVSKLPSLLCRMPPWQKDRENSSWQLQIKFL